MKKLVAVALFFGCAGWVVACGGGQKPPTKDPAVEVQQLMKLFDEARTGEFVKTLGGSSIEKLEV